VYVIYVENASWPTNIMTQYVVMRAIRLRNDPTPVMNRAIAIQLIHQKLLMRMISG
jgi:hypothetical protein